MSGCIRFDAPGSPCYHFRHERRTPLATCDSQPATREPRHMAQILLIFITALTFSILATPLVRRLALHVGVVDVPSARKIHGAPVPLLGGAAIYAGFMLALLFLGDRFYIRELIGILLGATLVSL